MTASFHQFSFNPTLIKVIENLNFKEPTNIQQAVIPKVLSGHSVVGKSQTGSGKTHAFLLPIFEKLDPTREDVQAVITAPTRELAQQLYEEAKKIITYATKEDEWIISLFIGGTDRKRALSGKMPHIVFGTPGRILDLVQDQKISLYKTDTIVLDEADLMMDLGFLSDIDQLLVQMKQSVQVLAFSATIPLKLDHFFRKYLKQPNFITIDDHLPKTIEHRLIARNHRENSQLILELSKLFHPYLALIFTNGKEEANALTIDLQNKGLSVQGLHGDLAPRERKRIRKDMVDLQYEYIVATDLASRGINIEGISHVINAQLPKEAHFYIHRVGRTARAGMEGMAISFYDPEDIPLIETLEKQGVIFQYYDVKNGEWLEANRWNKRQSRKNERHQQTIEQEAWKKIKKPKKVKPGYKKKMKKQQEAIAKKLRHQKQRKKK